MGILQDSCKYLARNVFPEKILQEKYCLEGSCKKCIDLQESYKYCIILQDSCKKYVFGRILQDSCKECIFAQLGTHQGPEFTVSHDKCPFSHR